MQCLCMRVAHNLNIALENQQHGEERRRMYNEYYRSSGNIVRLSIVTYTYPFPVATTRYGTAFPTPKQAKKGKPTSPALYTAATAASMNACLPMLDMALTMTSLLGGFNTTLSVGLGCGGFLKDSLMAPKNSPMPAPHCWKHARGAGVQARQPVKRKWSLVSLSVSEPVGFLQTVDQVFQFEQKRRSEIIS